MNNATKKQPTFFKQEILFSEIEFFNREEVSLVGQISVNGKMEFAQYITHKNNLHRMLKNAGRMGEEIIGIIVARFKQPHEVPVRIDLQEIFGKPVLLQSCSLKLDRSFYQNDAGDWKIDFETNLFFIDEVKPLSQPIREGLFA